MEKIVVNNALSNRVAHTFKGAIVSRNVIEKNKIEIVIDTTNCKNLFNYFCKKFHIEVGYEVLKTKKDLQEIKETMLVFVWQTFEDWGAEARKKAEKYLDSYASGYTKQHNEDYGWQLTEEEVNEVVKYVVENY